MTAQLIDGKQISQRIRDRIGAESREFTARTGVMPNLAAVLVGDDPASAVYVKNKHLACERAGMMSTVHRLAANTSQVLLLDLVRQLNAAKDVHGILVQLPLPKGVDTTTVLDAVHPLKDVDAFHPENVGLIVQNRPRFLPCTPHGIQVLLRESGVDPAGKHVVVLGRSEIVGKPIAIMLLQKGLGADATVTVCHSRTADISAITRTADILIAAIGRPEFVTADMVKPGAVIIDVGINRMETKLVGDVAFGPVSEVASLISPVPGGVGPMTIAMLLQNTLTAAKLQTEVQG
jgi:methylenetetrahydrofolate dehydrogenase (NADP+) / methenyltetrahydrofolate cyclohydrolase